MGEAKQRAVHGGYFGAAAPAAFVRAWIAAAAEPDAYLDLGFGKVEDEPVVVATLGSFTAGLTISQARGVADSFVVALEKSDLSAIVGHVSDLVVALRAAADKLEEMNTPEPLPEPRMLPGLGA